MDDEWMGVIIGLIAVILIMIGFMTITDEFQETIELDALDNVCIELYGEGSSYYMENGVQRQFTCQNNNTIHVIKGDEDK